MHVPGVIGPSRDAHHANWFDVTALGFSITQSGNGLATWTFGVTAVGTEGLPPLLEDAASQKPLPEIVFNFDRGTGVLGSPSEQLLAITLANVRLASTGSTITTTAGTLLAPGTFSLKLDLSFSFTRITFDVSVLDATGRVSPPVTNTFDLETNKSGTAHLDPVTYGFGRIGAPVTEEITGFTPQTENDVSGRTDFGPASVVIPRFDPSALNSMALVFGDESLPEAHVDFFTRALTEPTLKYDFGKVATHSVSVSGLTSTVSFSADDLHWTSTQLTPTGTLGTPQTAGWSVSRNMAE
jgi:hypothetical protein